MSHRRLGPKCKLALWCAVIFGALWFAGLESLARYLEHQVWVKSKTSQVWYVEPVLVHLEKNPLVPPLYQSRFEGLLGDLEYFLGDYSEAQDRYTNAISRYWGGPPNSRSLDTIETFLNKETHPFAMGFKAYLTDTSEMVELDDSILALPLEPRRDNSLDNFLAIQKPTYLQGWRIVDGLNQLTDIGTLDESVVSIRTEFREDIKKLHQVGPYLKIPDNDDSTLELIGDYVRLLIIDTYLHKQSGNELKSKESFDTAYRLLGYYYQNSSQISFLTCINLGGSFIIQVAQNELNYPQKS